MKFNKKILKNGLRIITVPMKDNPTVTVLVMVEAGSKYETKEINGLSHFLEHMCFKGTEKRPRAIDISRELDSIGAVYNAFTGQEYTGYYAKSDKRHLPIILDVVSDIYLHPKFDPVEIEKEKGVIIEEINMYEDIPQRKVDSVFNELVFGDQPAGWDIGGKKEVIKRMTRENFVDYREKHYVASATTIIIAGNFDEKTIHQEVEKKFANISGGKKHGKAKVVENQKKPAILVSHKKTDQAHLIIGVRAYDAYHKDQPVLNVIDSILRGGMSSRLFQKMREELGICYYVRSSNDALTDHGIFSVSAGVDVKRIGMAIDAILEEFRKLAREKVGEEELRKVKDYISGAMFLGLETSDSLSDFYGFQEILRKPLKKPEEILNEIEKVTADDILRVSKEIFKNESLNMAIVGNFKSKKPFEKSFSI